MVSPAARIVDAGAEPRPWPKESSAKHDLHILSVTEAARRVSAAIAVLI
jgi:hypothetical protein